jgi:lipopolysaccharide/colanic/teichoic acid biosynthesis glycosyltransferase
MVLFRVRSGGRHALSTVRLARTILSRARATDEIGWFDDQFLCAVLPDTLASGAWHFAEDVCAIIAERAPRPIYAVYSYPSKWFDGGDGKNDGDKGPDSPTRRSADMRPDDVVPTYADHESAQHNSRTAVRPMEHLLARPLPIWKRCIDILGASFIILMASPVMLMAALLIKLGSKGPALFLQKRAGLGGRPFTIYKFRTMCIDAEAKKQELRKFSEQDGPAFKMKRDPRVTRVGAILRKTSIDELPQLFNVIKGDMTLVGPRPLPLNESEGCERWQRRRLDVTPGLTCIWQVKGRSTVSFAEWVRMDVAYIRHRTLFQDVRILLQTVPAVLLRKGAS